MFVGFFSFFSLCTWPEIFYMGPITWARKNFFVKTSVCPYKICSIYIPLRSVFALASTSDICVYSIGWPMLFFFLLYFYLRLLMTSAKYVAFNRWYDNKQTASYKLCHTDHWKEKHLRAFNNFRKLYDVNFKNFVHNLILVN